MLTYLSRVVEYKSIANDYSLPDPRKRSITFGGAAIAPNGCDAQWSKLAQCKDVTVLLPLASALVVNLVIR
jgi:hypothetical protein